MQNPILTYSAVFLYFSCAALLWVYLKLRVKTNATLNNSVSLTIGLGAIVLHSIILYYQIIAPNHINLNIYNALSAVCAFIALFTLLATWRYRADILAIIFLPMSALVVLADATNSNALPLLVDSSHTMSLHIITSLFAYSLLAFAAFQAILLSIQSHFLHTHQPTGFIQFFPPLKVMEKLMFQMILLGFILLSVSLLSGFAFLENMFAQHVVHKTILSIIAWFVFAILLLCHWKLGWRGRTAVWWTLSGFISLMLAYFGSKYVIEILLK